MKVLVDKDKPRQLAVQRQKGITKQAQWSQKQKMEVVQAYLVLGNVMLVVAATGVPEDTVRKWKMTQWWTDAIDELRRGSKLELSGKLKDVVNKTILQLEDRVVNGDFVYNPKTGKYDRKLISAAVANRITNDLVDKTIILEKEATQEKLTDEGLEARLKKLKEEMIKFARAKTIEGEVIPNVPPVQYIPN
jgi:hypothetical protein